MKLRLLSTMMLFVGLCFGANAQNIPQDTTVIKGTLPNGLTYYVRANKQTPNRANFYIVQKVGSILENEDQRGLAHFLEHMAFHGSKHFPEDNTGKGIIDYLEGIGVKFGAQLNAYTAMDETVYNINEVPTNIKGATDSALLILADWSHSLFLRDKDITKERKVIHEEWRTRRSVGSRMIDSLAPVIFNKSKYAERMPIGLMSVVDNFKPEALRAYYHKWYRPDLQGIIVVGDIDAKKVAQEIKDIFSPIPMPKNPAKREYEKVPPTGKPIAAIAMDKEMQMTSIMLNFRREPIPAEIKGTPVYVAVNYMISAIKGMMNNRFEKLLEKPKQPVVFASASDGPFFGIKALDAFQVMGVAKPGESKAAIEFLLREVERVKKYGFTAGELETVSKDIVLNAENRYKERNKLKNGYYIGQYISNFLNNDPIYTPETNYKMMKAMSANITVDQINQFVKQLLPSDNEVLAIMGALSDKASLPTVAEAEKMLADTDNMKVEAYKDNTVKAPLLEKDPQPGKILSEKQEGKVTVWTLSNGAQVLFEPTDYKDDEVLVTAVANGGLTGTDISPENFKFFGQLADVGGLGVHSKTDLSKVLSGKNASANLSISPYKRYLSASSGKADVKTMMQLIYLDFTQLRKDNEAFEVTVEQFKSYLPQLKKNPKFVLNDSITNIKTLKDPYQTIPEAKDLDKVSYDKILCIYKDLAENASAFTFYIVGNTDKATLKPLVETYIASLPAGENKKFAIKPLKERKGKYERNFKRELGTHKATTAIMYTADMPWTYENSIKMSVLRQIFQMEFTDVIREKAGGTYGVRVSGSLNRLPQPNADLTFFFDCDPGRRAELVGLMNKVVEKVIKDGPRPEHLDKIKKYMRKTYTDNLKENAALINKMIWAKQYGYDVDANYMKLIDQLSTKDMASFAKTFFDQGNRIEVSMSDSKDKE